MDEELLAAINEVALEADAAKPHLLELRPIALELAAKFGSHTADEIEEQLHLVFRQAGLFWR